MVQASEAETKKYEEAQQSEQGAFQASIADLDQAVTFMQSCTDMSSATAVAEEVLHAQAVTACTELQNSQQHALIESGTESAYSQLFFCLQ